MLFKSQLLTEASGSIGGLTWAHNRGGLYTRARSIPINPQSAAQLAVRDAFADLSVAWSQTLSQAERDAWNLYAFNVLLPGPLGDPRNVGGMGQYIRSNTPRIINGDPRLDAAPTNFTQGIAATFSVAASEATQEILISLPGPVPPSVFKIQLQEGRPQTPGVSFYKGPFQRFATVVGAAFPLTATVFPFAIAAGQRLFIRGRALMTDGRLGPASISSAIVAA